MLVGYLYNAMARALVIERWQPQNRSMRCVKEKSAYEAASPRFSTLISHQPDPVRVVCGPLVPCDWLSDLSCLAFQFSFVLDLHGVFIEWLHLNELKNFCIKIALPKNSTISVVKGLVGGYHPVKKFWRESEGGDGLHEPRVAHLALLHVESRCTICNKLRPRTDFLKKRQLEKKLVLLS